MPLVIGVSFRKAGRIYAFDPGGLELREGDFVIAETEHGAEFGEVMIEPHEVAEEHLDAPLRPITRRATEDDLQKVEENRAKEREAFHVAQRKIERHGLPMKLIDVEYTLDGRRITFHFSAEGRVDFRKLVRDLAGHFRTRIELHQVGVRDEAKMIGGIGPCGRPLCCTTFLARFNPVTIKMAKEQGLALNPLKISGLCGRLMCCLNYENAFYREAKQDMPQLGALVMTERGEGRVIELRVPKGTCVAALAEGGLVEMPCAHGCSAQSAPAAEPEAPAPQREPADDAPHRRPPRRRSAPPQEPQAKEQADPPPQAEGEKKPTTGRPRRRRRRRPRKSSGGGQGSAQQGS